MTRVEVLYIRVLFFGLCNEHGGVADGISLFLSFSLLGFFSCVRLVDRC